MFTSYKITITILVFITPLIVPKVYFSQEPVSYKMDFIRSVRIGSKKNNHIITIFKITPKIDNFKLIASMKVIYSVGQGEKTINVQKQKENNIKIVIYGNDVEQKDKQIFNLVKDRIELENEKNIYLLVFDFYNIAKEKIDTMSITYGLWESHDPDLRIEKKYDFAVETIE